MCPTDVSFHYCTMWLRLALCEKYFFHFLLFFSAVQCCIWTISNAFHFIIIIIIRIFSVAWIRTLIARPSKTVQQNGTANQMTRSGYDRWKRNVLRCCLNIVSNSAAVTCNGTLLLQNIYITKHIPCDGKCLSFMHADSAEEWGSVTSRAWRTFSKSIFIEWSVQ